MQQLARIQLTRLVVRSVCDSRASCKCWWPQPYLWSNLGNLAGQVLTRQNIEDVIKFVKRENSLILAYEVYQHNIYTKGSEFHLFKKVANKMDGEYADMELASFMSTSKGFIGGCGYRGGYCEVVNLDPDVIVQLFKSISAKLCPTISGQSAMDAVAHPPELGEPSYELFQKEKSDVLGELALKVRMTTETLNTVDGVCCNKVMPSHACFCRTNHRRGQGEGHGTRRHVLLATSCLKDRRLCGPQQWLWKEAGDLSFQNDDHANCQQAESVS